MVPDEPPSWLYALVIGALLVAWYKGYFPFNKSELYTSEVGYYQGQSERFDYKADIESLEECRVYAQSVYRYYLSEGRATGWSCLLQNDQGGYVSRHR